MPNNGGCDFVADPRNSALIQPIFWIPQTDPATLPLIAGPKPAGDLSVRVDDLQVHAIIEHEAGLMRLALLGEPYDVALADVDDARRLGAFIMLDELTPDRLTAVDRLWQAMFGRRTAPDPRMTPQRRQRARQMLRAVDARETGAIYRVVAEHLFPQHKIDAASWVGDPIREITIRLARDGMKLVRGGYRTLLRRPRRDR
ncbi:MAG: DUF2285 domain-containing protein [Brevundimonas sp.]|uniref:DUF2285 domain-containing protein n=1 Tax=Brevundimonas sp. TaxID=1871086 RepID=UPI0025613C59|nr:DUF2285 domain-containing protein [Brevundimonas sp.]MDK2747109.1 DUF2285 domain-containing protein [Brevundimonas sp.]